MTSKKANWAEVDKRIRDRKQDWTADELKALEAGLKKLPDMEAQGELATIQQPAIASNADGASN